MKSNSLILFAVAILLVTSCKSNRSLVKTDVKSENQAAQLIDNIIKAQAKFNTANISKMSLEFTLNERATNVSASCKIKTDSAIFISIQPFMGIEVFKVELTKENIVIVDKMNRRYYQTNYNFLSDKLGMNLNYSNLQALLLCQFFCIGSSTLKSDSCKLLNPQTLIFENGNLTQSTEVGTTFNINKVVLKDNTNGYELATNYSEYKIINTTYFPQKIALNAISEKTKASCNLSILKVEFNTEVNFTAANPDRYTISSIEQLLKK